MLDADRKLCNKDAGEIASIVVARASNAELPAMSGPRNPYPGKLGVVEEGAPADLLRVDGNPVSDIHLIEKPARAILVLIKDGKYARTRFRNRSASTSRENAGASS